jgi:SpoVK/Ycf46/Vps4 family AAA+-type ATPase
LVIFPGLMFENKPQPGMSFGFGLPRTGAWRLLSAPLAWTAARLLSLGGPTDLSDLVITIEAKDRHTFKDHLSEITAPALVIAGVEDPLLFPSLVPRDRGGHPECPAGPL